MRYHAEQTGLAPFGNLMRLQEETREAWGFGWLDRLPQDLRYTGRTLRRAPGFTAVAILSLALGIGANTAIFSLINAILLRSLPVHAPEQLVQLTRSNLQRSNMKSFPYPFFRELRAAHNLPVTDAICITGMTPGLEIKGSAERVSGEMVSGNFTRCLASVLIWAVSLSPPMKPPEPIALPSSVTLLETKTRRR